VQDRWPDVVHTEEETEKKMHECLKVRTSWAQRELRELLDALLGEEVMEEAV
jgi:hypothetical protein